MPAPRTILVVEDDVFIRLSISDDLMGAGFRVIQAATADEALKVFQGGVEIDLLTTDIVMPGCMDGLALADLLRGYRPELKVIIISGHVHGVSDAAGTIFIGKPYQSKDLIRSAWHLLKNEDDEI